MHVHWLLSVAVTSQHEMIISVSSSTGQKLQRKLPHSADHIFSHIPIVVPWKKTIVNKVKQSANG